MRKFGKLIPRLVMFIVIMACLSVLWSENSWSAAAQLLDIGQVLKEASRIAEEIEWKPGKIEALQEIARAQAAAGDLSGAGMTRKHAMDMLDTMDPPEPKDLNQEYWKAYKISLLMDMVAEQAKAGNIVGSMRRFHEILKLTEQIQDPKKRSTTLRLLILQQIKIGDRTDSRATDQKILQEIERAINMSGVVRESERVELIVRIAETHLEVGDRESAAIAIWQALQETEKLIGDWERLSAYQDIAVVQARLGEEAAAMATAQKAFQARDKVHHESPYKTEHFKVQTVIRIADALRLSGNREAALRVLETARKMTKKLDARDRTSEMQSAALRDIAITAAKLGNTEMALEAEAAITDEGYNCVSLREILDAQVKAGHAKQARETADAYSKRERCPKEELLKDIALAQAKSGDVKGALQTVDLGHFSSPDYIRSLAAAKIETENPKEVLAWANSFNFPEQKAFALLGVAEGMLQQKRSPSP